MSTTPTHTKPEDEELGRKRQELASLESELADRELYIATLRAELAAFERRYLRIVGTRYAELDEINAQIAERISQRSEGDQLAESVARQARAHANESRATVEADASEPIRSLPSQELKSLYRQVAKTVHPDLSFDSEDRKLRQRLMAEANRAYEMGDVERLKRILEEYDSCPEAVQGEGVGADLVRVIRKITQVTRRLAQIKQELSRSGNSDVAKLKVKADEYEKLGRDLLAEMAEQVDKQIINVSQVSDDMDKKAAATAGNYLVPASDAEIARRSDSLVARGLRDLEAAEQDTQNRPEIFEQLDPELFERLDKIYLSYGRGTAESELSGFWKAGDTFTRFVGDLEPDGDDMGGFYELDSFLVGNDDLDFWNEIGDSAALTQEKLRDGIRKYLPKLLGRQTPGEHARAVSPPSSRIFVGADLFSSSRHNIALGLAIWSYPEGADVEIDGSLVGNTESSLAVAIAPGEHSVVLRKAGYETWSRKLKVRVPEGWSR
jgi:hypothetical protein